MTSPTYSFNPDLGALSLYAFNLIGVRSSSVLQEHLESSRMAANMLLGRWSSQGVNLWQVDLQTVPLVDGQATYSVPDTTIVMLDAYISTTTGSQTIDRIMLPVSRSEYANYPNKAQSGFPTTFWFNRQITSPTVTLYPVPDGTQTSLKYYRLVQSQDANINGAQTVNIPYYFLEAFAYGLALRLAMIWAPDRVQIMKPMADEAYQIAVSQNEETASFYISPQITSYFN